MLDALRALLYAALKGLAVSFEKLLSICFLIDFAALLYAKGFKLLALDRERTTNTATSC